jgi:hypothetical protein
MNAEVLSRILRWSLVFAYSFGMWELVLNWPPGAQNITSTYRLHFIHGLVCTLLAVLYICGVVDDYIVTMSSLAYFFVDLLNMFLNDFVFKVMH